MPPHKIHEFIFMVRDNLQNMVVFFYEIPSLLVYLSYKHPIYIFFYINNMPICLKNLCTTSCMGRAASCSPAPCSFTRFYFRKRLYWLMEALAALGHPLLLLGLFLQEWHWNTGKTVPLLWASVTQCSLEWAYCSFVKTKTWHTCTEGYGMVFAYHQVNFVGCRVTPAFLRAAAALWSHSTLDKATIWLWCRSLEAVDIKSYDCQGCASECTSLPLCCHLLLSYQAHKITTPHCSQWRRQS